MQEIQGDLFTMPTLQADFEALGVKPGMTLLLHSSMKSLGGWVAGGSVAVISALEEVLTRNGTLVMPTHTPDLSDPSIWKCPPVRESWWGPIMQSMPAFDADLTPCPEMGIIPDNSENKKGRGAVSIRKYRSPLGDTTGIISFLTTVWSIVWAKNHH